MLSQNYINVLGRFGAKVYIPKTKFNKEIFSGLKFEREVFLDYFKILKTLASKKVSFLNEAYLYKTLKTLNPDKKMSFKQFVYCLYTFLELDLFKLEMCVGGFLLTEQKNSTALENSEFYKTIKLIIETI